MSDEHESDIPPALSALEWNASETKGRGPHKSVDIWLAEKDVERRFPAMLLISDDEVDPGAAVQLHDANDVAALITLANELLRRFDDPRAFTHKHVSLIRTMADRSIGLRECGELHELADALESMLPPLTD